MDPHSSLGLEKISDGITFSFYHLISEVLSFPRPMRVVNRVMDVYPPKVFTDTLLPHVRPLTVMRDVWGNGLSGPFLLFYRVESCWKSSLKSVLKIRKPCINLVDTSKIFKFVGPVWDLHDRILDLLWEISIQSDLETITLCSKLSPVSSLVYQDNKEKKRNKFVP